MRTNWVLFPYPHLCFLKSSILQNTLIFKLMLKNYALSKTNQTAKYFGNCKQELDTVFVHCVVLHVLCL